MSMIEIVKVFLISVVEGITEWLPISSTGHMLLLDEFIHLNMSESFKEMFFVVIQLGAIFAVVVIYWHRMWPFSFSKEKRKLIIKKRILLLWLKVAVACVPSAVLGVLLDDILEAYFGTAIIIALMLIGYGIWFIVIENKNEGRAPKVISLEEITYGQALVIGLFQVLAMIPGTSRSGATIIGGLLVGISRVAAAEFTFFLAVPTMLGASALKLAKFGFSFQFQEMITLLLGMALAFVVSVIAIKFLMGYIKKHNFKVFGWYRIGLGILVLVFFGIKAML